jgi:4-amino-4-deoxy-L-arabinose transferase-like glycosyltransferase
MRAFPQGAYASRSPWIFVGFIALVYVLFFHRLGDRDLWSSHEARAGMDAATALRDHTWGVTRLFDGHLELQKPPLYYWLVAGVAQLCGVPVDAWAVRLPSALSAVGCLLLMFTWLRARGRPVAAVVTVAILATAGQFPWLARIGRIDMPLTLTVATTLGCFHLAGERLREGRRAWPLWLGMYMAMAAGVMLKGPIGVVLPVAVLGVHLCLGRMALGSALTPPPNPPPPTVEGDFPRVEDSRRNRRLLPAPPLLLGEGVGGRGKHHYAAALTLLWGIPLVLALTVPWFVLAHIQTHGEFTRQFFWHHNVERGFGGDDALRPRPWWLYGQILAGNFLPWSPLLLLAFWWFIRRQRWKQDSEARFGLIWLATIFVLLSCLSFKRADYLLPAFPGAALFLGCVSERWLQTVERPRWVFQTLAGIVVAMAVGWFVTVEWVMPRYEPAWDQREFAAAIRREVPASQGVLFFRAENHALAFHLGTPLNTFLEWENLDVWAGRPGHHYILMRPECAEEWPQHVHSGRLEKVLASTDLAEDTPEHPRLVLMRTLPLE